MKQEETKCKCGKTHKAHAHISDAHLERILENALSKEIRAVFDEKIISDVITTIQTDNNNRYSDAMSVVDNKE